MLKKVRERDRTSSNTWEHPAECVGSVAKKVRIAMEG